MDEAVGPTQLSGAEGRVAESLQKEHGLTREEAVRFARSMAATLGGESAPESARSAGSRPDDEDAALIHDTPLSPDGQTVAADVVDADADADSGERGRLGAVPMRTCGGPKPPNARGTCGRGCSRGLAAQRPLTSRRQVTGCTNPGCSGVAPVGDHLLDDSSDGVSVDANHDAIRGHFLGRGLRGDQVLHVAGGCRRPLSSRGCRPSAPRRVDSPGWLPAQR